MERLHEAGNQWGEMEEEGEEKMCFKFIILEDGAI